MPRTKLLSLLIFVAVCLISAGLLQGQEPQDAFNAMLRDISQSEGRTVTTEQLLDYSYSEVFDDFQKECRSGTEAASHYLIFTVLTDQLKRYVYHVSADASRAVMCSMHRVVPTETPTVDLTQFTATPTLIPTVTETPRFGAARCESFMYSRLRVGEQGRVLPGEPNRLREWPDVMSSQLRLMPAGATFDVLEGPRCDMGSQAWWRVRYLNTEGWTLEGYGLNYYVEPVITSAELFPTNTLAPTRYPTRTPRPTSCPASPPFRLALYENGGGNGRVLPGAPNNLRARPNTDAPVIAIMPGDAHFDVIWGPQCDSAGRTWWQVRNQGKVGWTVEGEGDTYYVEPTSIGPTLAPGD